MLETFTCFDVSKKSLGSPTVPPLCRKRFVGMTVVSTIDWKRPVCVRCYKRRNCVMTTDIGINVLRINNMLLFVERNVASLSRHALLFHINVNSSNASIELCVIVCQFLQTNRFIEKNICFRLTSSASSVSGNCADSGTNESLPFASSFFSIGGRMRKRRVEAPKWKT